MGRSDFVIFGGIAGAATVVASTFFNQFTSTDRFCTSCHTMAVVATESHALNSPHAAGIRVRCAECHLPATNWLDRTYVHGVSVLRDTFAEFTHDYSSPGVWSARRRRLAEKTREEMRANDSLTCRRCHEAAAMRPATEAGRAAHVIMAASQLTCIQCHANLVHAPQQP